MRSLLLCLLVLVVSVAGFGLRNPTTAAWSYRDNRAQLKTATPWIIDDIPNNSLTNPTPSLLDAVATFAATIVLDAVDSLQGRSLAEEKAALAVAASSHHYLSSDELIATLLKDITDRNSLVTADFTRTLYQEDCLFNDGSDLDGAYPLKPWILGCKLLFCGDHSRGKIVPESLVVSAQEILFRFESDLEFRGPFQPRVQLCGTIVLTRNLDTGRICYYQEYWDTSCSEILRRAEFQGAPVLKRTLRFLTNLLGT